jgi:hypothetical protein
MSVQQLAGVPNAEFQRIRFFHTSTPSPVRKQVIALFPVSTCSASSNMSPYSTFPVTIHDPPHLFAFRSPHYYCRYLAYLFAIRSPDYCRLSFKRSVRIWLETRCLSDNHSHPPSRMTQSCGTALTKLYLTVLSKSHASCI